MSYYAKLAIFYIFATQNTGSDTKLAAPVMKIKPIGLIKKLYPSFIWNFPDEKDGVFLTFDDGPRPEVTPWVLDLLDKYDAKATFFCIGKNVELFPELYQEIIDRGHAVGNHSYSHVKGWGMPTGDYIRDIDIAADTIRSNLFRPPYARIGINQARMLAERYKIIMWNIISRDYNSTISGARCARNVIPHIQPGDIIVFHNSIKSANNMFYALPLVMEAIKEKGLICKKIEL